MRTGVIVLIVVALLTPASWAGGEGWRQLETRLGIVESEVDPLETRVTQLEFKVLVLQSRLNCHLKPKACTIAGRRP